MKLLTLCVLMILIINVISRDNDDDEGRPYEFGFTIDGQQHRHELKDVNGIIMGEFGFITADGIYHVTMYATDENGSFKILSMKNIRVSGPLDDPNYKFPNKPPTSQKSEKLIQSPNNEQLIPTTSTTTTTTTTKAPKTDKAPYVFTTLPSLNVPACSSCKLPSTTPKALGASDKLSFQTPQFQNLSNKTPEKVSTKNDLPPLPAVHGKIDVRYQGRNPIDEMEVVEIIKPSPEQQPPPTEHHGKKFLSGFENYRPGENPYTINQLNNVNKNTDNSENPDKYENPFADPIDIQNPQAPKAQVESILPIISNNPKHHQEQQPITVSNQQINIPGRDPIPLKYPYPNMEDGLPNGITEKDMLDLLYKFNYTVGFHGHYEKGLKNGTKIGSYFVNGRDGISRIVQYVADENGYRPKVRFVNLGLDSPDTPKEGTEKTFGLKSIEFVWYPV